MSRFIRIRPDTDPKADPGWRFRIEREAGEQTIFAEEQVLPEQVLNPDAQHVIGKLSCWLTAADVEWLHGALGELLAEMRKPTTTTTTIDEAPEAL